MQQLGKLHFAVMILGRLLKISDQFRWSLAGRVEAIHNRMQLP